jgi:cytochrome c6
MAVRCLQLLILAILLMIGSFSGASVWASDQLPPASTLFEVHCAGCHPQGGNIIRRGKNLKQKALQANHLDSPAAIAQLIAQGKGNMTAFGDRLPQQDIDAIAAYVLSQAAAEWKS